MAENTKIEWADHTFNPWIGCTKVGPGCDHCYAENMMYTRLNKVSWGPGKPRQRTSEANWNKPLQWNRKAEKEGKRYRVFCASLADWLDNEVPIEWLIDLLDLIHKTPNLDWLLLTKRIGNFIPRLIRAADHGCIQGNDVLWIDGWREGRYSPDNIWLGITVVNQEEADRDIPKLIEIPASVRFLSIEPMLGHVELRDMETGMEDEFTHLPVFMDALNGDLHTADSLLEDSEPKLDWVIAGGESGPNARPAPPDWFRSLRDQCEAAGVPFLFKQWGEWMQANDIGGLDDSLRGIKWYKHADGTCSRRAGKKLSGRLLDGREHNGFPEL